MKKILHYIVIVVCACLLSFSCELNMDHEPITEDSGKPASLSNAVATPVKGGAIVQYTLPEAENVLYVKGIYQLANGEQVEVKSSFYNNYIIVEGLGDTLKHKITLYTVNRSEVSSDPVEVEFTPLPPAFWDTRESVQLSPTFGGLNLKATNEARDDLAYLIMMKDTITKEWRPLATSLYTGAKDVNYSVRGYSSDSTYSFALVIRDRFENYSDTLYKNITPYFEEELSATNSRIVALDSDATPNDRIATSNWSRSLFDDRYGENVGFPSGVYLTNSNFTPFEPHLVTIDLGITARVSRLHVWDYPEYGPGGQNVYFARGAMKEFEIYGAAPEEGLPHDNLDSGWVKLGVFENIKPSGLPEWIVNSDDIEAGNAGFDYEFPDAPEVRYIRFRCLKNWEGGTFIALAEVKAYGNDGNPDNND